MKEELDKYHDYLNGTSADQEAMEADMIQFLEQAENAELPEFKQSEDQIWAKIDELTPESETKSITWNNWYSIAAVVSLLLAATFIFLNFSDNGAELQFQTALGESKELLLPDGSKVTLNAESSISYSEDWNRELILKGEAFFEVTKGEKFTVQTANGNISVLGTSFNVYSRKSDLLVDCKTGKVRVEIPTLNFDEILTPGKSVVKEKDSTKSKKIDTNSIASWRSEEIYFDNRPFSDVLDEIRRQYNVTIEAKGVKNRYFTGYFVKSDLDNALQMVCEPLNLAFEVQGNSKVTITMK